MLTETFFCDFQTPGASDGEQDATINPSKNVNREKSFDLTVFKNVACVSDAGAVTKFLHRVHTHTQQKARKESRKGKSIRKKGCSFSTAIFEWKKVVK